MEGRGVAGDLRHSEFPLFRLIDGVRESDGAIVARVEAHRQRLAGETGLTGLPLAERLAAELIDEAALKSALIEGGTALPFTLPLVGFWGTLVVALGTSLALQTANEVELVYALAAAYRTRLSPERLREVAFWLVRLSNFEELQQRALSMGVKVTVRRLVEKLVAVGLARALGATAPGLMSRIAAGGAMAPQNPWYIRATGFLGVPVLAVLGWRSTKGVGDRAVAYFAEELGTVARA